MLQGEKITEDSPPISRSVMQKMAAAYYRANTQQSYLRRLLIVVIFVVAGRAGEMALTFWALLQWNFVTNNLYFNWSQSKTSKQKGVGA